MEGHSAGRASYRERWQFLGKAFGPAVEAAGGLLGNQLGSWRARNLDRLEKFWRKRLEERSFDLLAAKALFFGDAY